MKYILLLFAILLNLEFCYSQENEEIVYIRRYNVSLDVGNTTFGFNKKINGVADLASGTMINIYGEESKAIEDFRSKIGYANLDSFYLETFKGYLYKSKEKIGRPNPSYLYFGEFFIKNDTISAFARQSQENEKIEKEILQIISSARIGDVKGDIYYFRDFEFTGGTYLRHCKSCSDLSVLRMTTNGSKYPSGHHRAVLTVEFDSTDQKIDEYIESEGKKRQMDRKGTISTQKDGEWQIILTHSLADKSEVEYEYLLKKENKFFIAKYTCPNIIEYRRFEIEEYLSTFKIK